MLILKGNFIKDRASVARRSVLRARLWTAAAPVLAAVLAILPATAPAGPLAAVSAGAAARTPVRAPETVAAEFYRWYLETLTADQDPLSDRHERFAAYVARPLVEQLVQRLQARAGPPAAVSDGRPPPDGAAGGTLAGAGAAPVRGDYFLQSERIDGAWLRSRVRAITVRQQARAAHVLVTLDVDGNDGAGAKHELLLTMVLEGCAWKIRHVNRASVDVFESSPDRPII